jgi:uridine phosphorylase
MAPIVSNDPVHLRPNAQVAERALLPGDPGRALRLAQILLAAPMQVLNTNRGLWGYTGTAADGRALTIQSTGMGGPSAVIVAEELIGLGARRLVRVGTCGALDGRVARWVRAGAVAVEMEAAALFTVASRRGAAAACLLAVADLLAGGGRERIGDAELVVAERTLGESALAALS